jgi:hypothetical protein
MIAIEYLPIPRGGRSVLAKIAWPEDSVARKRFSRPKHGRAERLSRDELGCLQDAGGHLIQKQLNEWGLTTRMIVEWLLEPDVVPLSPEEAEGQRRDLLWQNGELRADLLWLKHKVANARKKGSSSTAAKYRKKREPIYGVISQVRKDHPSLQGSALRRLIRSELKRQNIQSSDTTVSRILRSLQP